MSYDSSLITGAEIVTLTGFQNLGNLTTGGDLTDLDAFALSAHRAVFRTLEAQGIDPTLLSNENRLKDAVAYEALYRLALARAIGIDVDAAAMKEQGAESVGSKFRPEYTTGDTPRHADEGIPAVGHYSPGLVYSGDDVGSDLDFFTEDTPTVR